VWVMHPVSCISFKITCNLFAILQAQPHWCLLVFKKTIEAAAAAFPCPVMNRPL
jgi:hypothetical protein